MALNIAIDTNLERLSTTYAPVTASYDRAYLVVFVDPKTAMWEGAYPSSMGLWMYPIPINAYRWYWCILKTRKALVQPSRRQRMYSPGVGVGGDGGGGGFVEVEGVVDVSIVEGGVGIAVGASNVKW